MTIKVLVNGAFGRMGQMTTAAINEHPGLELVGQTGREYDLAKSIQDSGAEVVIDFTAPTAVFSNAKTIIASGARPVIGTSGLKAQEIETLKAECAKAGLGGVIAPHFSLGGVLMMKYAKEIAKYLPNVEIIEFHHDKKIDSPSGTSIRTAELLAQSRGNTTPPPKPQTENVPGARGAVHQGIPIHSIRLPGLLAHQSIIFGESGETLTIRHDSIDRKCYMPGVTLACEKVMVLKELVVGLENLL